MKAFLRVLDALGDRQFELPRERFSIGSAEGDSLRIQTSGEARSLAALEWDVRQAAWIFCPNVSGEVGVSVNGRLIDNRGSDALTLNHLDIIEFSGGFLQFIRILANPTCNGEICSNVLLGEHAITFGRAHPTIPANAHRVELEAEDPSISREALVITKEGDHFCLVDKSRTGVELNGLTFQKETLVYGDRFRISGYIFEFTGNSARRIQPEMAGSIEARGLTVEVGERRILDDVSLNISAGEFIGVLGRSGQGKSTFLNALCGVNPATKGTVRIGGVPISDRGRLRDLGIGYVPQDDIVHKELTVRDAITYSARLRLALPAAQSHALVERTLEQLGLEQHALKRVEQLSGGQRKRVSIAIELLAKPSVLFLDEPSSGLDPATEAELMTLLQSLTLTKLTVVCTTHVLHKAYLFDRMLFVEGGQLIFAGSSDDSRRHFLLGDSSASSSSAFEKSPLERIYTLLQGSEKSKQRSTAEWKQLFDQSTFGQNAYPLIPPDSLLRSGPGIRRPTVSAWKTLLLLALRQWTILSADRLNIAFLLVQPILIGFLIGWVAEKAGLRLFLTIVATMWFGCSNGAQQIISELAVFRRERVCGQSIHAYILSKLGFLSMVSLGQAALLLFATLTVSHLLHAENSNQESLRANFRDRLEATSEAPPQQQTPDFAGVVGDEQPTTPPQQTNGAPQGLPVPAPALAVNSLHWICEFFQVTRNVLDSAPRTMMNSDGSQTIDASGAEVRLPGLPVSSVLCVTLGLRILAIAAAALVSVAIGLLISSLVKNATQAVLWVPLVLIPQILFGGIVVSVPEMAPSVRAFSRMMPSFSAQRIMDVGILFAMNTPKISNRTKTPLFLSSLGESEPMEWTEAGQVRSQNYDKISAFNSAFQNLLVMADRMGEHKWVTKDGDDGSSNFRDSVDARRDVLLHKGTPYRSLAEVYRAAAILGGWILLSYAVMFTSLLGKQTGK